MKNIGLNVFIVVVVLQSMVFAQEEDTVTKTFTTYMYGRLNEPAQETAVKTLLAERPEIINETLNDVPIFQWTLDHLGYNDHQVRKANILAELLIRNGADIDGRDKYGDTLLLHKERLIEKNLKAADLLLSADADPNAPDIRGNTCVGRRKQALKEYRCHG